MYHRVNDDHPGDRLTVRPAELARQLELLLESGRRVVSLDEALGALRGEQRLEDGSVAITFDDGFRDNYDEALPLLERFGVKGCFFIATDYIGSSIGFSRYSGCCDRDATLGWDHVREMAALGHAIGGHGRSHRELAGLSLNEVSEEVGGCRDGIERETGSSPRHFCYPRGSESAAVRAVVQRAGFASACSVYPGSNGTGVDPFALRRTEVAANDSPEDFVLKLAGGFDGWHRLRQALGPL